MARLERLRTYTKPVYKRTSQKALELMLKAHHKTGSNLPGWIGKTSVLAKRYIADIVLAKPGTVLVDTQDRLNLLRKSFSDEQIASIISLHLIADLFIPLGFIGLAYPMLSIFMDVPWYAQYSVAHGIGRSVYGVTAGLIREATYTALNRRINQTAR